MKCLGGPAGCEGILVACQDGHVFKIYVNNSFPCLLWKHRRAVRYADLSALHSSLALVDDDACLCTVSMKQGHVRSTGQNDTELLLRSQPDIWVVHLYFEGTHVVCRSLERAIDSQMQCLHAIARAAFLLIFIRPSVWLPSEPLEL
jgi:hypothetical protein